MLSKNRIIAGRQPWQQGINIYLYVQGEYPSTDKLAFDGVNRKMVVVKEGADHLNPFSISMEHAQALMDSLYDCGIRPTDGSGSAGQALAVQEHVKDLRKILNAYLNIKDGSAC